MAKAVSYHLFKEYQLISYSSTVYMNKNDFGKILVF